MTCHKRHPSKAVLGLKHSLLTSKQNNLNRCLLQVNQLIEVIVREWRVTTIANATQARCKY